jgi:mannose-6-phosphate isomerase-like protein (cupin superfamily)
MLSTTSQKNYFVKPDEGRKLSVLGDTITCKLAGGNLNGWQFFELSGSANSGPPPHTHPWEEGYYILAGEVEVLVGEEVMLATPGYFIHIPANTVHTFNIKSPQAKFLFWVSDDKAEKFFAEIDKEVKELPPNMEKLMTIAQKHQVIPVSPEC